MTVSSNVKELHKSFEINNTHSHNPYEFFSISAIGDDIPFRISSKCNSLSVVFHQYSIIGKLQRVLRRLEGGLA